MGKWADAVADGELGTTELIRLADRVGNAYNEGKDGGEASAEDKFKEVCDTLGLGPHAADEAASIDEVAFAAACRAQEIRHGNRPVEVWFAKLELELVEERSCLDDLCLCCGM